ncbi:hypothetical protein CDIK_0474 [Cucumispora dikerogammari]|nr:hypothetical protein CDIK_0474 [Cucumispora dikerogammari]
MLSKIFLLYFVFKCEEDATHVIITQPTISNGSLTTENLFGDSIFYDNRTFIETTLFFKNSDLLKIYALSDDNFNENCEILFSEAIRWKKNRTAVFKDSEFCKEKFNNSESFGCLVYNTSDCNKKVLRLIPDDLNIKNPLIKYLEENPLKVFKLRFIFPGTACKNVIMMLKELIEDTKKETLELRNLDEKIDILINPLYESLSESKRKFFVDKSNLEEVSDNINDIIQDINNKQDIIERAKKLLINYLETTRDYMFLMFSNKETEDKLQNAHINWLEIKQDYHKKLLNFFKKKINQKLKKENFSASIKDKIQQLIKTKIGQYKSGRPNTLTFQIKDFENIVEKGSRNVSFETHVFRLNRKGVLKRVREVNRGEAGNAETSDSMEEELSEESDAEEKTTGRKHEENCARTNNEDIKPVETFSRGRRSSTSVAYKVVWVLVGFFFVLILILVIFIFSIYKSEKT